MAKKKPGFHINRQHGPRFGLGYQVINRNGRTYHVYDIPGGGRDVIGMGPQKGREVSMGRTTDKPTRGTPKPASMGKGFGTPQREALRRGAPKRKEPKL